MSFLSLKTTVDSPTQHPGWNTFGGLGEYAPTLQPQGLRKRKKASVARTNRAQANAKAVKDYEDKENKTLLKTLAMFIAAGVITNFLVRGAR